MKLRAWQRLDRGARTLAFAFALLVVAALLPPLMLPRDTWEAVVVLDITQSMNVEDTEIDGKPASRIAFARHAVRETVRTLPCGSRVGLAAFTEYRTLLLLAPIEVCANYNDFVLALDAIDGRMRWSNASEIAKGVYWSIRVSKEIESRPDMVFITDGQEAPPIDINSQPVFDGKAGEVRGWLVGVGGDAPRPIPKTDADGRPLGFWRADEVIQVDPRLRAPSAGPSREHLSSVHEPHLRLLAQQVGFDYARVRSVADLGPVMRDRRYARRHDARTELNWLPAAIALVLLAWQYLPERPGVPVRLRRVSGARFALRRTPG